MIYRFDILGSTNDEARNPIYKEGDVVIAERQTAGRGQRGHTWESAEGEKCERCWKFHTEVDANGLCPRCAGVVPASEIE